MLNNMDRGCRNLSTLNTLSRIEDFTQCSHKVQPYTQHQCIDFQPENVAIVDDN